MHALIIVAEQAIVSTLLRLRPYSAFGLRAGQLRWSEELRACTAAVPRIGSTLPLHSRLDHR